MPINRNHHKIAEEFEKFYDRLAVPGADINILMQDRSAIVSVDNTGC